ncbi:hypothetical protein IA54_005210 [Xanthomonas phaseoli pv. syngonii LMG 9055]|uniref:Uncharacterized protein n=1 Tax=Xanthomonas phaseoli pv. syngonii LMG 9055 TaxID=1437878 RepID=A0A1V9H9M6_9XANT|nr:hypothetical protein IA54_005210 [Xanthomonas phaseoli pv. syngonii LMG 9055]
MALSRQLGNTAPMQIGLPVSTQSPGGCLRTSQAEQTTGEVVLSAPRCARSIDIAGLLARQRATAQRLAE